MSIELEKEKSIDYKIVPDKDKDYLVQLTLDNVARVEAMIYTDSSYSRGGDDTAIPNPRFKGSSAYWFNIFKKELEKLNNGSELNCIDNEIIFSLVSAIDSENSTHLNAHPKGYTGIDGRTEITNRIMGITKGDFTYYLSNPTTSEFKLYKILAEETKAGRKRAAHNN